MACPISHGGHNQPELNLAATSHLLWRTITPIINAISCRVTYCIAFAVKIQLQKLSAYSGFVMVALALYNRADHYMFALWFLYSFFLA